MSTPQRERSEPAAARQAGAVAGLHPGWGSLVMGTAGLGTGCLSAWASVFPVAALSILLASLSAAWPDTPLHIASVSVLMACAAFWVAAVVSTARQVRRWSRAEVERPPAE